MRNKDIIKIFLCIIIWFQPALAEKISDNKGERLMSPDLNDMHIGPNGVVIPLGKILLMRRASEYCAVKFTKFWTGKTEGDRYAEYESFYQGDHTGTFSNRNVKFIKEKLSAPKPRGIGRLAFSFGNKDIRCGPVRLWWGGGGSVHFFSSNQDQGDYGIELAPTIWTDISQVNVFDPRIKWYRYDEERQRLSIPIDKLWETEP
jgi:hypothetical protein